MRPEAERMYLHTGVQALLWPAEESGGEFASAPPAPELAAFVERIHFGHEWIDPARPLLERVLPDGGVHLVFDLGEPPAAPGSVAPASQAVGARCGPSILRMSGRVEQVTVTLRPGGIAAVLGVPAAEIAGGEVPLDALWQGRAAEAVERLAAVPRGPARAVAVQALLRERIAAHADPAAAEAVRRIHASRGRIRVRELAAGLGIGERRLGQVFERQVGLPPKAVCRIARFRATVALLQREPERPWTDVAYGCGFYDQSHLVHEFQSLAGLPPGEFRERGCGFFQDASPAAA
jgi:AraC-like DNA-binding protein